MTDKNTGGPAFPCEWVKVRATPGMTLRDYLAAKALQGLVTDADVFWEGAAPLAYQYADAMMKARGQ